MTSDGSEQQVGEPDLADGAATVADAGCWRFVSTGERRGLPRLPSDAHAGSCPLDPALGVRVEDVEVLGVGREAHRRPLARRGVASDGLAHDHHLAVVEPADHVALVAERLDHRHRRRDTPRVADLEVLGAHADDDR